MKIRVLAWPLLLLGGVWFYASSLPAMEVEQATLWRSWIESMKEAPRGPFTRIRWFCHDGTVLPPGDGVCRKHGGGKQYGQWNRQVLELHRQGLWVANVLAALKPEQFTGASPDLERLKQVLFEQYLIAMDDGWVFRRARFYRGAIQFENEQAAARAMLLAMLDDPAWRMPSRYLLLRESVRLLPIATQPLLAGQVRKQATDIAEKDPGFQNLRLKIHSLPDARDAAKVRDYAAGQGLPALQEHYEKIAHDLDQLYAAQTVRERLQALQRESTNRIFRREMQETVLVLKRDNDLLHRFSVVVERMESWRHLLLHENTYTVYNRLRFLRASLILEQEVYVLGNRLPEVFRGADRKTRLKWIQLFISALHASGMLSDRQQRAALQELTSLLSQAKLSVADYQASLHYLSRISQWSQRSLGFLFDGVTKRWQVLTPMAQKFVPDRLRESPLLPFSRILDVLVVDANRLAGIRHRVFGKSLASGMRALNPGLRRGVLLLPPGQGEALHRDGIYILRSTTRNLSPVAGIITLGEGSSVSHVQLLARNMGIPNLVVDHAHLSPILEHLGERVVLAVSKVGAIMLSADNVRWERVFRYRSPRDQVMISINMNKLDLEDRRIRSLGEVRATDSGRSIGPKAANLGELYHYYPDLVNPGLVIPFGIFRQHLRQPIRPGGPSVFDWMQEQYVQLAQFPAGEVRDHARASFLSRLRQWIIHSHLAVDVQWQLRRAMKTIFGPDGSYGVFVRSDTNVEDLPGFSGAGLNLTVPNVVGFDAIIASVLRVWASPFTERAFAWRQAHMRHPEHVYPAVLLMKSFPSQKSGVMVTVDVDNGSSDWLSIAANEGIGGVVDGQAAEELRVHRKTATVRLMAQASAPFYTTLAEAGGLRVLPASGREVLLQPVEIEQLRQLAADVQRRFPLAGSAADIEFGFHEGHLALFQIRPFVESRRALQEQILLNMDRHAARRMQQTLSLTQTPQTEAY